MIFHLKKVKPAIKELKSTLQGSIEKPPENVLNVATSNRRHLIPEQMTDNEQSEAVNGEIHHSVSMSIQI